MVVGGARGQDRWNPYVRMRWWEELLPGGAEPMAAGWLGLAGVGVGTLTGGHCASLSEATICTLRCLAWDLPRDFTNRCSTWGRREGGVGWGAQGPQPHRCHLPAPRPPLTFGEAILM